MPGKTSCLGAFRNYSLYSYILIIFIISCAEPGEKEKAEELPGRIQPSISTPDFNADSAYFFIEKQVEFGPRVIGTKAHDSCAEYLINKLRSYNLNVIVQKGEVTAYNGTIFNIKNIIARFNLQTNNRILLCAHWDTRPYADQDMVKRNEPFDGANDGGSGVGVLLEIARQISRTNSCIGVDIIFFDAEDYGDSKVNNSFCLGSQYWAKNQPIPNYYPKYGILLDMVGSESATFSMEGYSRKFAFSVVKKIWDTAAKLGYSDYFIYKKTGSMTDDHYYINTMANIPCVNILHHDPSTRTGFGTYWHTHDDNMEIIDKSTLKAVGQTLLEIVYKEK
ncbi:MAG: M28 family peptidase [Bacteroidota bacterium]